MTRSGSKREARIAGIEPTKTVLGRTFTRREIDALPVPGRDFTTLATLTPGVLPDLNQGGGSNPNLTGFATAAQNGRNNAILIDGVDSSEGPQIVGTLLIDRQLPNGSDPNQILTALGRVKELREYLRCETPLPNPAMQARLASMCALVLKQ